MSVTGDNLSGWRQIVFPEPAYNPGTVYNRMDPLCPPVTIQTEYQKIPFTFDKCEEILVVLDMKLRVEGSEARYVYTVGEGELYQSMMQFDMLC